MDFKDTQCGAKIFHKDMIDIVFKEKFVSKWLFDVELFMRIKNYFTVARATELICEQPLTKWEHVEGSKLSMKDALQIFYQLLQIHRHYNIKKKDNYKGILEKNKHAYANSTFRTMKRL